MVNPRHNLIRDGSEKCARYVIATITKGKGLFSVYLDPEGGMRVIPKSSSKQSQRPDSERVGMYRKRLMCEPETNAPTAETVAEDLVDHFQAHARLRD